jgi:flagellin-like protein
MIRRSSAYNNEGVSSIIGVILMVALTVVLASVLGQFVFGLVGNLSEPPQAGAAFKVDATSEPGEFDVRVVATAMPNADKMIIRPSNGPGMEFEEVGDSQIERYSRGTTLTVLAVKGDERVVSQIYTVGRS